MTRPIKLSYELIEKLCELIAQGCTYDRAARGCDISVSTFHGWMRRGKQEGAESIYKELVASVKSAAEYSEDEALQQVRSAAIGDRNWKAAAWFLERRFPDRYGRGICKPQINPGENSR